MVRINYCADRRAHDCGRDPGAWSRSSEWICISARLLWRSRLQADCLLDDTRQSGWQCELDRPAVRSQSSQDFWRRHVPCMHRLRSSTAYGALSALHFLVTDNVRSDVARGAAHPDDPGDFRRGGDNFILLCRASLILPSASQLPRSEVLHLEPRTPSGLSFPRREKCR